MSNCFIGEQGSLKRIAKKSFLDDRSCDALVAGSEGGALAATLKWTQKVARLRQNRRGEGAANTSADEGVAATIRD